MVPEISGKIKEKYYPREMKIGLRNQELRETKGLRNRNYTVSRYPKLTHVNYFSVCGWNKSTQVKCNWRDSKDSLLGFRYKILILPLFVKVIYK